MDIKNSIVAILNSKGKVVGTGFLASQNLVVTCAHVIVAAGTIAGDTVQVRFHGQSEKLDALVVPEYWRDAEKGDVAVLRLENVPEGITPLPLGNAAGSAGHDFYAYGYATVTTVQGIGARGKIVDIVDNGRLVQLTSQEPDHGMSGGPVLDEQRRVVIGMVTKGKGFVGEDKSIRNIFTTFSTSVEVIREVCPELRLTEICPYRSLDVFNEEDASFFFGREKVVQKLLDSLKREPRFLAVLGPSGSGKSSVVRAGLIPALRQGKVPGSQKWEIVTIRPANDPFKQLAGAGFVKPNDGLESTVKTWLADRPDKIRLVLIIDQFEEVLVSVSISLRQKFIAELAQLLDAPVAISVIVALRDDFYSRLLQDALPLTNWIERGLVNIPPILEQDDLKAIIIEPAKSIGLIFEDGLVDVIVADANETDCSKGVAQGAILPLLEFALTQLWDGRRDGKLTHDAYHSIGRVSGGLSLWAEKTYYSLNKEERDLTRRILIALVNLGDEILGIPNTKRVSKYSEVVQTENDRLVIQKLILARLIIASYDKNLQQENVEIIHEALLTKWPKLSELLHDNREYLRVYRQFAESAREWKLAGSENALLYRGARLAQMDRWHGIYINDFPLNELEKSFLETSLKQQEIDRQVEKLQAVLISLSREASLGDDVRKALDDILIQLSEATGAEDILVFREQMGSFECTAGFGNLKGILFSKEMLLQQKDAGLLNSIMSSGKSMLSQDFLADTTFPDKGVFSSMRGSAWLAPIKSGNRAFGVITFFHHEKKYFFPELINLFETIADQIANNLVNTRLYEDSAQLNAIMERMISQRVEELNSAYTALEKLGRDKTSFMRLTAHEMSAPLSEMVSYLNVLKSSSIFQEQEALANVVDGMCNDAAHLQNVINTLLDVVQLESQAVVPHLETANVRPILEQIQEKYAQDLRECKITLEIDNSINVLSRILADANLLEKALDAIVNNAIKFTPSGGFINLSGEILDDERLGRSAEIRIKDTGVGVDPPNHKFIFEKMYQVNYADLHPDTDKFKGGLGLGLTIAQDIIKAHKGKIWVESSGYDMERLPGSTFFIRLPLSEDA